MSLDLQVYTNHLSDDLISHIQRRLNDYEMIVEIHPEFSFRDHKGFLPFKFSLTNPPFTTLKNIELISGFELYADDFDLINGKNILNPKQGFLNKLIGRKQDEIAFASPEIEDRLKDCKKELLFNWHLNDCFENRFALLTSAIITELTDGVCYNPQEDVWYDNQDIVNKTYKEIIDIELSINENELIFHKFEGWN